MKIWIIVIVVLLAAFIGSFVPVTKSDSFKINASYENVYRQFVSPKSWLNWQPDLKLAPKSGKVKIDSNKSGFQITAPSLEFSLQNIGLGNFEITETRNGKLSNFSCILTPENTSNKTLATVISKTNLFGYLSGFISNSHDRRSPIPELKTYMEDTRLFYGFTIRKELTQEKLIVVKKGTFLSSRLYQQSGEMLNQLNNVILKNKLKIVSPLQLQYVVATKDSMQIMMGFPVDKKATVASGITYMTMPRGKILAGDFNGVYKNKEKLYAAMRQYMRDNYIRPLIQPFERFDSNKLPASDTSRVNMQLIVPYM